MAINPLVRAPLVRATGALAMSDRFDTDAGPGTRPCDTTTPPRFLRAVFRLMTAQRLPRACPSRASVSRTNTAGRSGGGGRLAEPAGRCRLLCAAKQTAGAEEDATAAEKPTKLKRIKNRAPDEDMIESK